MILITTVMQEQIKMAVHHHIQRISVIIVLVTTIIVIIIMMMHKFTFRILSSAKNLLVNRRTSYTVTHRECTALKGFFWTTTTLPASSKTKTDLWHRSSEATDDVANCSLVSTLDMVILSMFYWVNSIIWVQIRSRIITNNLDNKQFNIQKHYYIKKCRLAWQCMSIWLSSTTRVKFYSIL